ncbi:MAG: hypothetical protein ACI4QC_03115 [Thermoguttaceae bacterium]
MSTKDLCAAYGKTHTATAVNAAIRAEIPGGSIVLDLLERASSLRHKSEEWSSEYVLLSKVRDEMFNVIARKYGLRLKKGDGDE